MNGLRLVVIYAVLNLIAVLVVTACVYPGYMTWETGIVVNILFAVISAVGVILALMKNRETGVTFDDKGISVVGAMMNIFVPYSSINSVDLMNDVKYGERMFGYSDGIVYSGNFYNKEFGEYKLSVNNQIRDAVVVHHNDDILVFNYISEDDTQHAYDMIKNRSMNITI